MGLNPDFLLKYVRAYDTALVDRRRQHGRDLYSGGDSKRAAALAAILDEMKRPLVLVLETPRDTALSRWLAIDSGAKPLFRHRSMEAWLAPLPDGVAGRTSLSR
jgi:hypothetical protein